MAIRLLSVANAPNADGGHDAREVHAAKLDGALILDRILEDVYLTITRRSDGSFGAGFATPEDVAYARDVRLDSEAIFADALSFLTHGAELETADDDLSRAIMVWDDALPLDAWLTLEAPFSQLGPNAA